MVAQYPLVHGISVGEFFANAVRFNGVTYLPREADFTGNADSKLCTFSFWWTRISDGTFNLFDNDAGLKIEQFSTDDRVRITGFDTGGTIALDVHSIGVGITDWHHILGSFDMADPNKRHVYVDDAQALDSVSVYSDAVLDFTAANHAVGGGATGARKLNGNMSEFWLDFGTYIDFSQESNRRKFISPDAKPVDLGGDGSLPTGTAPILFLSGETSAWHVNKGTGGGLTEDGTLTTADTSPSD